MTTTPQNPVAALNDSFRSLVGMPRFDSPVKGQVVYTRGISALPPALQIEIWFAVAQFDAFTPDNDPYGEHDFGSIDLPETERIFWKIDTFADETMHWGAEHPADPARSYRVLTIMLASEY